MSRIDKEVVGLIGEFDPAERLEIADRLICDVIASDPESTWREGIAQIIMSLPFGESDDPDSPISAHLAVDVAELFGADAAQQLYRFAVLVTKIAGAK
jgi:acyl-CoA synthetase (AMP-forming)/AMP-acid ligase II